MKPKNKQELIDGIMQFWQTVGGEKTMFSIHWSPIKKILPKVTEVQGEATGY